MPVVLAYAPFGLTLGRHAGRHAPAAVVAWSSSPLLFGGAAQLLAVQLLDAGASAVLVVLGALVVNARMLLYSAALAPHTRRVARALAVARRLPAGRPRLRAGDHPLHRRPTPGGPRERLRYYLTVGIVIWTAWMGLTGAGVLLGGVLPTSLRLDLAAPLTFLLLLLPMLTSRPAYAAAVTGGTVAVAASGLPLGLGLLAGAAAGIAVGGYVGRPSCVSC